MMSIASLSILICFSLEGWGLEQNQKKNVNIAVLLVMELYNILRGITYMGIHEIQIKRIWYSVPFNCGHNRKIKISPVYRQKFPSYILNI